MKRQKLDRRDVTEMVIVAFPASFAATVVDSLGN